MKLGILTLPLHTNYGGIMQAYALQLALNRLGHETILVNLPIAQQQRCEIIKEFVKRFIKRFLLLKPVPLNAWPTLNERKIIAENVNPFIQKNLHIIECNDENFLLNLTKKENLDGYIVGSDQIWRPSYSSSVSAYFLDFLDSSKYIRISYAASFGMEIWPFSKEESQNLGDLIKKFDAVSVREDSAVTLCKEYWNIDADLVLDPTLLLDKQDYLDVCGLKCNMKKPKLLVYILDKSQEKNSIIDEVSTIIGLPITQVMAKDIFWNVGSRRIEDCIVPPISEWISGFMNAEYVVTDSFHGMVFSILFRKSFICIGNRNRGLTRFTSLLKLLDLEERLIYSMDDLSIDIVKKAIDYRKVEILLYKARSKSIQFLTKALSRSI